MADETQAHLDEAWAAWTDDRRLWVTARGGPVGGNLQAQWPDGNWGSIGDFTADGSVLNKDVPHDRQWARDTVRLRAFKYGDASGYRQFTVRPALVVTAVWTAAGRLEVTARGGPQGANLQAQWPDGNWASIGDFNADGTMSNPNVPSNYQVSTDVLRLRVFKPGLTFTPSVDVRVRPPLTAVSAVRAADGKLQVTARGGPQGANLQAQWPDGNWASIGDFTADGTMSNPNVPADYKWDANTLRLRVHLGGRVYDAVEATIDFPQPRLLALAPCVGAGDEEVRLQLGFPFADYQPTGYFAPAGQEVSITVYGHAPGLEVLVGAPGMANRDDPKQFAPGLRVTALKPGINKITDPHGGIIHLRRTTPTGEGEPAWLLLGGTARSIPYHVQGKTTAAQWRVMLDKTTAPEVEMVSERVVIAALLPTARRYKDGDPAATLAAHHDVVAISEAVSGMDGSTPVHAPPTLRLYAVETSSAAPPHAASGYIGLPHEDQPGYFMNALLSEAARNSWVMLHEYGHHFQQDTTYGDPEGITEISVNLYALAVNQKFHNERTDEFPGRWPGTQKYLALPRSEKKFGAGDSDPQAIFEQLRLGLGPGFLPAWHKHVRAVHGNTTSTYERKKWFVVSACTAAGRDLTGFFADWGLLKESETDIWDAVRALALPKPDTDLTKIRPYT
ncbi:M60 family metallopeptidase [Planotetraspora sp. GP83]|uniref:M60 family metallopeptidase n=1 Tax=Planotetraspora sp. GP83 TaxID=3156264 RepID=UPI00351225CD